MRILHNKQYHILFRLTAAFLAAVLVFHSVTLTPAAAEDPSAGAVDIVPENASDGSSQPATSEGDTSSGSGETGNPDPAGDPSGQPGDPAQPGDAPGSGDSTEGSDPSQQQNPPGSGEVADPGNDPSAGPETGMTGGAADNPEHTGDPAADPEQTEEAEESVLMEEEEEETEASDALLAAPSGDYVDVTTYGEYFAMPVAIPDDGLDDTTAFRKAVGAILDNEPGTESRTLYVPAGTYHIDTTRSIQLGSDITVLMEDGAVLQARNHDDERNKRDPLMNRVFYIQNADNVRISGGEIRGDRTDYTGAGSSMDDGMGIYLEGATNVTIENVDIYNCKMDGVFLNTAWDWDANGKAVGLRNCRGITVSGCEIYNNRRDNISIIGADDVLIDSCNLYDANGMPNQCGILIEPEVRKLGDVHTYPVCHNITISNSVISSWKGKKATSDQTRQHLTFATYLMFPNVLQSIKNTDTPVDYSTDTILISDCVINGDMANYSGKNVTVQNTTVNGKIEYAGSYRTTVTGGTNRGVQKYGTGSNSAVLLLDAQGGVVSPETVPAGMGKTYAEIFPGKQLPVPVRTGYRFTGWFTEPTGGDPIDPENSTIDFVGQGVIYAQWETTQVTLDAQGGEVTPASFHRGYEETYGQVFGGGLPVPHRDGYRFAGWYDDPENGQEVTEASAIPLEDHTLYARWSRIYTVTLKLQGGRMLSGAPLKQEVPEGDIPVSPREPVKAGYRFTGWYNEQGVKYVFDDHTEPLSGDLQLFAGWSALESVGHPQILVKTGLVSTSGDTTYSGNPVKNATVKKGARVSMTTDTTDAAIYYVMYGDDDPSVDTTAAAYEDVSKFDNLAECALYTDEIEITKNTTIWAIAVKDGYANSGYAAATYRIFDEDDAQNPENWGDVIKDKDFKEAEKKIIVYRNGDEHIYDKPSKVPKGIWVAGLSERTYTGAAQTFPQLRVYHHKTLLQLNRDYTVSYKNNVKISGASDVNQKNPPSVLVNMKGNYSGQLVYTFEIKEPDFQNSPPEKPVSLGDKSVTAQWNLEPSYTYSGEALGVPASGADDAVTFSRDKGDGGKTELKNEKDFFLTYSNNIKPGTATVVATGIDGYTGSVKRTFKITAYNIAEDTNDRLGVFYRDEETGELKEWTTTPAVIPVFAYEKGGTKPQPVVKDGGTVLTNGTDYTLSYKNNVVTINGKGGYTKSMTGFPFAVKEKELSDCTVTATDLIYNGKAGNFKSTPVVRDTNGAALKAGTDYDSSKTAYYYTEDTELPDGTLRMKGEMVQAADTVPAGTPLRVHVTGKGMYTGEADGFFRIVNADFSKAKITVNSQYYTGEEIRPGKNEIVVTLGGRVLSDVDYEIVSYANNINRGTATVTLRGVGYYGKEKTAKFTIAVRPVGSTIVFHGNRATSGSVKAMTFSPAEIEKGTVKALTKNAFKRTGYTFLGWSTSPEGQPEAAVFPERARIIVTEDEDGGFTASRTVTEGSTEITAKTGDSVLTLYAVWAEPDPYTITWHLAGGINHPDNNREFYRASDRTFTLHAPDRADWPAGYQFAGWYTDSNYKNKITEVRSGSTGDLHLYAKWTPYQYTVVFHGNGATKGSMKNQTIAYGELAALSANGFSRSGAAFAGWSLSQSAEKPDWANKEAVWNLATPGNSDQKEVHLYAVWKTEFRITYVNSDGNWQTRAGLELRPPETYRYGTGLAAGEFSQDTNPVRPGYLFAGWYDSPALKTRVKSISKSMSGDLTLYAKWTPKTFTIRFDGNGKTAGSVRNQTVTFGVETRLNFNAFSRKVDGQLKEFKGWAATATKPDKNNAEVEVNEEDVIFKNGAVIDWTDDWSKSLSGFANKTTVNLYAVWGEPSEDYKAHFGKSRYTVTFDANIPYIDVNDPENARDNKEKLRLGTAKGGLTKAQTLTYGKVSKLSKNTFSVAGFTFRGWSTRPDGTGDKFENTQQITGEEFGIPYGLDESGKPADPALKDGIVLYAMWGDPNIGEPDEYHITYNNEIPGMKNPNLSEDPENPGQVLHSTIYTIDSPTIRLQDAESLGSTFLGWYSDKACRKRVTEIKAGSVGDRVLYAKWRTDSYTIVYELNGGCFAEDSGSGYVNTYHRADNTAYQLPVPEKEGFTFVGWYREKNFKTLVKEITGTTGASITLYAKWTEAAKQDIADAHIRIVPQRYTPGESITLSKNDVWITFDAGASGKNEKDWEYLNESDFEIVPGSYLYNDSETDENKPRARVTIRGTGKYKGTQMVYFDIRSDAGVCHVEFNNNAAYCQGLYGGDASFYTMGGTMEDSVLAEGARIPANAFTSKLLTFTGWNTQPDGKGTPYADMAALVFQDAETDRTVILYAQWEKTFYFNELTYEPTPLALENQRPIAVMIDNEQVALPHYGMSEADVVYEMMNSTLNNRVTRYMAIYKDWKNISRIGNVRSTRPTNALLFPEWNAVLFHEGAPYVHTNSYFSNSYTPHIDGGFSRISNGKAYEFTSFLTLGQAATRLSKAGISESYSGFPNNGQKKNHFEFNQSGKPVVLSERFRDAKAAKTADLTAAFPKNKAHLEYNAAKGTYDYYEYGAIHKDAEDGAVLSFKNVILQKVSYTKLDENGYLIYNVLNDPSQWSQTSDGWYLTNGQAVPLRWKKHAATDYTRFFAYNNENWWEGITVDTGKTYIALVPEDMWGRVSVY